MQTLILFGIPNCSTVKKARDWLEATKIVYQFHDFKKHGILADIINGWFSQISREQLINRAGHTWRGLQASEKDNIIDNASAMALMQAKTSIIKRPILVNNGKIICLGFDESTFIKELTHD